MKQTYTVKVNLLCRIKAESNGEAHQRVFSELAEVGTDEFDVVSVHMPTTTPSDTESDYDTLLTVEHEGYAVEWERPCNSSGAWSCSLSLVQGSHYSRVDAPMIESLSVGVVDSFATLEVLSRAIIDDYLVIDSMKGGEV